MNSSKHAANNRCGRWLATAVCATVVSIGVATSARADEATAPSAPIGENATPAAPTPSGGYIASVTANGTGCPAGSWDASIAPSGDAFLTFSRFESEVSPSAFVGISNCMVAVTVRAPKGVSYTVRDVDYYGYAYLEEGVELTQMINYYFSGRPVASTSPRRKLVGPYDDTFLFSDRRDDRELTFSECGKNRDLNIVLRIQVVNTENPRRNGYANVNRVRISGKLAYKACDATADDDAALGPASAKPASSRIRTD